MQTLREFRKVQAAAGKRVGEGWLRRLCRRGLFPGAEFVAGRVWMLPDDARYPEGLIPGRKPAKREAEQDAARMAAGFGEALELTRKAVGD